MGFRQRRFAGHGGMRGGMRYAAYPVPYPPEEKEEMLKNREIWLQEQLEEVRSELKTMADDAAKDSTDSSSEEATE
jgi:sugar-specific transcriptional regulator TrmB